MRIGLDIGSTTIKVVVLSDAGEILFSQYTRHFSRIAQKVEELLGMVAERFPDLEEARVAVSGSAGLGVAEACGLPFVQEVYATRVCVKTNIPDADVAIELGGEDAKILFLDGIPDARMNGSCAGGTGAFIDQMATLLKISPAELNERAKTQRKIYTIASRCGVFAKTDIQPLLNQGARVEDISASILYAVVNQTIAGLAQGRKIEGKIVYLGGPLTFLSELRAAFDKVLGAEGILPEDSLYFVATGAAMCADTRIRPQDLGRRLEESRRAKAHSHTEPLFRDTAEYEAFAARHAKASVPVHEGKGYVGRAHLGIDAGSTTVKTALITEEGELLHLSYHPGCGNPVPQIKQELIGIYQQFPGMTLASVTVTGYGEQLCKEAFRADFGIIETMAHYLAAKAFQPEVDFIIDIGGQDMKCFKIVDGFIGEIFLNEACSSGCGSFLQTFAEALGQEVGAFARLGLFADAPVDLGSRCTVFMNSSVKQAQKDGVSLENVSAGLAVSVVKNALYKVIRATHPRVLGENIVVQGGTFLSDAVLRAFERELGRPVVRPTIAGQMGAFGAALYGRDHAKDRVLSDALTRQELLSLTHEVKAVNCGLCGNRCALTVNTFSGGRRFIGGNRCDRPVTNRSAGEDSLDLYAYKQKLLAGFVPVPGPRGKIGLPMVLNLWETLPFWHTALTRLGFEVVTSPRSSRKLYFKGQSTIPSDTVCYPAKLAHGHIQALLETEGVDTIFYPCMTYNIDEGLGDNHYNCPVVAYYPEVIEANMAALRSVRFISGHLGIHRPKDFAKKLHALLAKHFPTLQKGEVAEAARAGYAAYASHLTDVRAKGAEIIAAARQKGRPIIILAGRPYHVDGEINHGIHTLIRGSGAAVITEDSISHLTEKKHTNILNQWTYHARLFSAARYAARQKDMHLVQLVSFGCGLDAVVADEVREILSRSGKLYTQIKIDENANLGAVNIRLRSLFAALGQGVEARQTEGMRALEGVV